MIVFYFISSCQWWWSAVLSPCLYYSRIYFTKYYNESETQCGFSTLEGYCETVILNTISWKPLKQFISIANEILLFLSRVREDELQDYIAQRNDRDPPRKWSVQPRIRSSDNNLKNFNIFFRSVNFNTKNLKPLFNVLLIRENSRTPTLTTVFKLLWMLNLKF